MGNKWDALLGKSFNISKFKTIINIVVYRIALLKNKHHVRSSQARSDVIQLLTLSHHESALLRVSHVIREQNLLDAFFMIEGYCHLLMERVMLIKNSKACPEELKEAISSLIFAASRCGQVPELQKIRGVFTSKFGKQFATCAVELRNNCGVNPKIVKKLPLRRPSMKTRLKLLKEIASENGITLRLERETYGVTQEKLNFKESTNFDDPESKDDSTNLPKGLESDEKFASIMKARDKYRDVSTAAEAAFELAANAAAAAKAVSELSRFKLREKEPDNQRSQTPQRDERFSPDGCSKPVFGTNQNEASESDGMEGSKFRFYRSFSQVKAAMEKISPSSDFDEYTTSDSTERTNNKSSSNLLVENLLFEDEIGSDENNGVKGEKQDTTRWLDRSDFERKCSLFLNELSKTRDGNAGKDGAGSDENLDELKNQSPKGIALKAQPKPVADYVEGGTALVRTHSSHSQHSNRGRKPISARNKRTNRI